ncbi:MAG TPA: hypothetical protein VEB43_01565 [Anaeromyxobacter sp.]|nr:hypothetical protein [Anaeromyxobacter sp.]
MRAVLFLFAILPAIPVPVAAQPETGAMTVRLTSTPAARALREQMLSGMERARRQKLSPEEPLDPLQLRAAVRETYAAQLTLERWYAGLTPASRRRFQQLVASVRPEGLPSFPAFYAAHRKHTVAAIRDGYASAAFSIRGRPAERPATVSPGAPVLPLPSPQANAPNPHAGIAGSKLVLERTYSDARRYHLTTPSQSIFLRGFPPASAESGCGGSGASTVYPDYCNRYCDKCCGPPAGQSLLAWFNVPVRRDNGQLATTTWEIQRRLANLMETKAGIDYTDPDDFGRVLGRSEFRGDRGYCNQKGGGERGQLHYMLARGTPVVLLLAWGDNAHYTTVYSYDVDADLYDLANASSLHWSTLRHRWSFDAAEDDTAFGLWLVGAKGWSLWSYSDDGCETPWTWRLPLAPQPGFPSMAALYLATFSQTFSSPSADPPELNFYGLLTWKLFPPMPLALVTSSGEALGLAPPHTRVLVSAAPAGGAVRNLSVSQPVEVSVEIDGSFASRFPDVQCAFTLTGVNGTVLKDLQRRCVNGAPSADGTSYRHRFTIPYAPEQRQIRFALHGGLRSTTWTLAGCVLDNDLDGTCDERDPDDDQDGIADVRDVCPLRADPDQTDNDHDGVGLACDPCEACAAAHPQELLVCACADKCFTHACIDDLLAVKPLRLGERFLEAASRFQAVWWKDQDTAAPAADDPAVRVPPRVVQDVTAVFHLDGHPPGSVDAAVHQAFAGVPAPARPDGAAKVGK